MNIEHILASLLLSSAILGGCELIDLGDTVGDAGDTDGGGGNEDDTSAEDAGNGQGGGDGDGDGDDDSSEPVADGTGGDEPPLPGESGGQEPLDDDDSTGAGEDTTSADPGECIEGDQYCLDELSLAVCYEGELWSLDCHTACVESGWAGSIGCFFDRESGYDMCWCDDGTSGKGGA